MLNYPPAWPKPIELGEGIGFDILQCRVIGANQFGAIMEECNSPSLIPLFLVQIDASPAPSSWDWLVTDGRFVWDYDWISGNAWGMLSTSWYHHDRHDRLSLSSMLDNLRRICNDG